MAPKKYTLFISHSSNDNDFLRQLETELTALGVSVWIDFNDLQDGTAFASSIDKAILESEFYLLFISPSFFGSFWTKLEIGGVLNRMAKGDGQVLTVSHQMNPKQISDYSPLLSTFSAIDAQPGPAETARRIKAAIDAFKSGQTVPEIKPAITLDQLNVDLTDIYTPASRHGREQELAALLELLGKDYRVVTLTGMGGIGKSVLACWAAEQAKLRFERVLGFSLREDTSISGFLSKLGTKLYGKGAQQVPVQELQTAILDACKTHKLLFVLDNYESVLHAIEKNDQQAIELHEFLNRIPQSSYLLITSRDEPTGLDNEEIYSLEGLDRASAIDVIRDGLSSKRKKYSADILNDIAEKLADHPLACRLIGGYLAESPLKPEQVVEQVREILLKVKAKSTQPNLISFEGSLALSLNVLTPEERKLIEAVSVFEGPFTAEAAAFIGEIEEPLPILDRLCHRSLMQCRPVPRYPRVEIYSIHSLIRETIWISVDQERRLNRLADLAELIDSSIQLGRKISDIDFLVSVQEMLPDLVHGAIRLGKNGAIAISNLAILLEGQGKYSDAIRMLEESQTILIEAHDEINVATCLHQIGIIYQKQGDYPTALEKYQRSLKIANKTGDKAGIVITLHQIGMIYHDRGDYPAALENYQRSFRIAQKIGDNNGIASTLHQIGLILQDQGDYAAAFNIYNQSLKIKQEIGDKAKMTPTILNLGNVEFFRKEYNNASNYYQTALNIAESIGDIYNKAKILHQIGSIYHVQGDYSAAMEKYQQSLKIKQEIGDKAGVGITLAQIGLLFEQQDDIAKAIELTKQALAIFERIGVKREIEIARGNLDRMMNAK